ncbi:anti-sigma factor [Streptomyces sp. NBC_00687]|uniref:anti-sigma factor n=1 Tax=Streptomyces sp. NBC_00687 TaxID=2975807 RepID=UPI00224F653B|nr:anti-sigma factor [Streptomyces sp. NBC_00687]MCX4912375.1 anti-sigma factor [Streptomyces sp. NBC_00687]
MTAEDQHQLVGAYVLHALPPDEEAAFDNHLADCAACREEVAELSAVTLELASGHEADPSPELRGRVLDRITRTRQEHITATGPNGRRGRVLRVALAACLAVAAALGGVAVWQHQQADEARTVASREQARTAAVTDIVTAGDATITTQKLDDGGDISVVASRAQGRAAVVAAGLPQLGKDRVYELWYAAKTGDLRPAGLLPGSGGGHAQVLRGSLEDVAAVGITAEPAGGSEQPTSEPLGIVTVPA